MSSRVLSVALDGPLKFSVLKILSPGVHNEKWQTTVKVLPSRKLYVTGRVSAKGIMGLWPFVFIFFTS